jgi:hypothetical protein
VFDQHSGNRRSLRPTRGGEARQEHLLFEAEVKLALIAPKLKEGGLRLAGLVIAGSAQALGDDECLVMIARESLEGWVALHVSTERGRAGRRRRMQGVSAYLLSRPHGFRPWVEQ